MSFQSIPYILLLGLFFGSSIDATRFGISQFSPAIFAGLRFAQVGLSYLSVYAIKNRQFPIEEGSLPGRKVFTGYKALFLVNLGVLEMISEDNLMIRSIE
jgi:hypothetical protein